MASLKTVKDRIATVTSTLKITSAMKMIASAKLHKAQSLIENMLPYERMLNNMLIDFLSYSSEVQSIFTEVREIKSVAIVVFSSNTSLVGGYNANVIRRLTTLLDEYKYLGYDNIHIYPIGKKVAEAVKRLGFKIEGDFSDLAEKPTYDEAANLAKELMYKFQSKHIDKVELLYHHFKNRAVQSLTQQRYLPIELPQVAKHHKTEQFNNFIIEPSEQHIMEELLPKVLLLKMYTIILDSNASEHAARTMAMQLATDNANTLLQEISLQYNKSRQQSITNELLDIVGGTFK